MATATNDEKSPTPQDKLALRTGKCIVPGCPTSCEVYSHEAVQYGFNTCVCGHTQWAHEKI